MLAEVETSTVTLRRLFGHETSLGAAVVASVRGTVEEVERRLARDEISVVLVGEHKSGKSTFLDALVGDRSLSSVLGRGRVVTALRRRSALNFRAKFGSGAVEEFARRVPDRSKDLNAELADAEEPVTAVEASIVAARASIAEAEGEVSVHERDAKAAFDGLEAARNDAQRIGGEISALEDEITSSETALATTSTSVPASLRGPVAWWAIWSWLTVLVFMLFRRAAWQRHAAERKARDQLRARRSARQREASTAAEACMRAEGQLARLGPVLDDKRAVVTSGRAALTGAEARRNALRAEIERVRGELEAHDGERRRRFLHELETVVDERGRGKDLVELAVDYPARLLPEDVSIIDAPGVMADDADVQARTWETIRQEADGCILLSELERGVSTPAKRFLQQAREVVPHVLLVLTKADQAFEMAVERGGGDPWEQVEQARRIGTRRFAREIGRDADGVLSIAVAAEAALDDGGVGSSLARRFETEVEKLFKLLRQERALILGARSAAALRGCIAGIADAKARAEHGYKERITDLEANRIPEPEAFRDEQIDAVAADIERASAAAVDLACGMVRDGFALIRTQAVDRVTRCRNTRELTEHAGDIEREANQAIARVRADAHLALENGIDTAIREIEKGIFDKLRARYDLVHQVRRELESLPRLEQALERAASVPVSAGLTRLAASFQRQRVVLGVGGIAAGAAAGTAVLPGIGSAIGAVVGALLGLVRTTGTLKKSSVALLDELLGSEERAVDSELAARAPALATAIREALGRSLDRVIHRFARFIAEPIEAERKAIERERANLADLQELGAELEGHDDKLAKLMKAAGDESLGLCR